MSAKKNLKHVRIIVITVICILLVPLIAMQFTPEVQWNWLDFLVAGTLLFAIGLAISWIIRASKKTGRKIAFVAGAVLLLIIIWAELAVGLFGTPLAGS